MYKALKGTWGENKNKICFSDRPLHFGLGFCVRLQDLDRVYLDLGLYIHYKDFSALLAHQHGCVVPERYFSLLCFCDFRGHCCVTINTNIKLEVFNRSFGRMSNLGKKVFSNLQHLSHTYWFFDWQVQCSTTTSCTDSGISADLKVEPSHFSLPDDFDCVFISNTVFCVSAGSSISVLCLTSRLFCMRANFSLNSSWVFTCHNSLTTTASNSTYLPRKANVRNTWSILG